MGQVGGGRAAAFQVLVGLQLQVADALGEPGAHFRIAVPAFGAVVLGQGQGFPGGSHMLAPRIGGIGGPLQQLLALADEVARLEQGAGAVDAVEIGVEENFVQGVETGEAEHQDESRQDGKAVDDEGESLGGSGS